MRFWKLFRKIFSVKNIQNGHVREEDMDENQKREYQTVMLAALLHDIGKLMQRAEVETLGFDFDSRMKELCPCNKGYYSNQHVIWTKYFIDEIIKELPSGIDKTYLSEVSSYHHKTKSIVNEADILSSSVESFEDDEKEQETHKNMRLNSIFDIVQLKYQMTDKEGKFYSNWYYELNPLEAEEGILFPVKKENLKSEHGKNLVSEYKKLWYGDKEINIKGFEAEFKEIQPLNFDYYFNSVYYLLQKYTWSIPSATNVFTDISLFDHLKTTSAIAACLYWWEKSSKTKDNSFILLAVGISGIQDFIYKITAAQSIGGIAKRLRGRSFYLTMLPELMAKYLVDRLDLTIANINFCGGGVFELLLPNTEVVKDKLNKFEETVNDWLIKEFYGELSLILEKIELSKPELMEKYGEKKAELEDNLTLKKKRKFSRKFKDKDFIIRKVEKENKIAICKSCNLSLVQKAEEICYQCKTHRKVGEALGKAKYIIFTKKGDVNIKTLAGIPFEFGNVYLSDEFDSSLIDFIKQGIIYDVQRINYLADSNIKGFTFLGNTLPTVNKTIKLKSEEVKDSQNSDEQEGIVRQGQTLSFESLAEMSIGDKKIGLLKMDIDYLGFIFSMGLKISRTEIEQERKSLESISRISTLSRGLIYFFTGYINNICQEVFEVWKTASDNDWASKNGVSNEDIKNIFYISYSGGDDLLIVGPWSEIPILAQRINDKFRAYTCHNPNISLSAGIFICNPKYPISIAAKKTGDELDERSKALGRNRVTLFGETAVWGYEKGERWKAELVREAEEEIVIKGAHKGEPVKVKTFYDYFELANSLYEGTKLKENKLPRSFIYGLIMDYQKYFGDSENLNIIPALVYKITRNVKDDKIKEELKKKLITEGNAERYLRKIRLVANYALMKSRK